MRGGSHALWCAVLALVDSYDAAEDGTSTATDWNVTVDSEEISSNATHSPSMASFRATIDATTDATSQGSPDSRVAPSSSTTDAAGSNATSTTSTEVTPVQTSSTATVVVTPAPFAPGATSPLHFAAISTAGPEPAAAADACSGIPPLFYQRIEDATRGRCDKAVVDGTPVHFAVQECRWDRGTASYEYSLQRCGGAENTTSTTAGSERRSNCLEVRPGLRLMLNGRCPEATRLFRVGIMAKPQGNVQEINSYYLQSFRQTVAAIAGVPVEKVVVVQYRHVEAANATSTLQRYSVWFYVSDVPDKAAAEALIEAALADPTHSVNAKYEATYNASKQDDLPDIIGGTRVVTDFQEDVSTPVWILPVVASLGCLICAIIAFAVWIHGPTVNEELTERKIEKKRYDTETQRPRITNV
eukprot:TRINITY_DN20315_c0_g1_i1.p1 TRINITY_DN20315_c0_g1~~TRINITY_DN20315_c0_g1_i1.p1  ORF type:complete len:414 (+),score=79.12 TRINITY_DN20315_c0_g1_i1:100-1341(+)